MLTKLESKTSAFLNLVFTLESKKKYKVPDLKIHQEFTLGKKAGETPPEPLQLALFGEILRC